MILLLATVFIGTLALLIGAYVFFNRGSLATMEIARRRLRGEHDDVQERARSLLKDDRVSSVPFVNRMLSGRDWINTLRQQLDQAGLSMMPGAFVLLVVTSGFAGTMLGARMESSLMALLYTALGWVGPVLWIRYRKKKRLEAFERQLPDAIDMIVSAMKAGYSFQAATQFVGDEVPDPLGPEFARFYDEQRLGVDVRTALLDMQTRTDSLDLKMFVTAVLIQRESGGNLGEVLSNIADVVRQRIAMKGQIQALVAEPKMSARFLAVLPVVVFLILSAMNPKFLEPLVTTGVGKILLIAAGLSVIAGYMVMLKIADVDI
jgi:tight adherence protein B